MTYAAMKAKADAAIASYVERGDPVVIADLRRHVNAASGIDYASTTIAKLLKKHGYQRVPATGGAEYAKASVDAA